MIVSPAAQPPLADATFTRADGGMIDKTSPTIKIPAVFGLNVTLVPLAAVAATVVIRGKILALVEPGIDPAKKPGAKILTSFLIAPSLPVEKAESRLMNLVAIASCLARTGKNPSNSSSYV